MCTSIIASALRIAPKTACEPVGSNAGDPKAIPWTHLTPIRAAVDAWAQMDVREGEVMAWPTNLGWMMGPFLIYAALFSGATIGLFNVSCHLRNASTPSVSGSSACCALIKDLRVLCTR